VRGDRVAVYYFLEGLMHFTIIGIGSLAIRCILHLRELNHDIELLYTNDEETHVWAMEHGFPSVLVRDGCSIKVPACDYLLSINNPFILNKSQLARPLLGAINYHDSLLPNFAGMHATSWAIFQNLSAHGISWHKMTTKLDSGAILIQESCQIDSAETAESLNLKCFELGFYAFKKLLNQLEKNTLTPLFQLPGSTNFYTLKDKPFIYGIITFDKSFVELKRLFRACDFGSTNNTLVIPKFFHANFWWMASDIFHENNNPRQVRSGIIISVEKSDVLISCQDAVVRLVNVTLLSMSSSKYSLSNYFVKNEIISFSKNKYWEQYENKLLPIAASEKYWLSRIECNRVMKGFVGVNCSIDFTTTIELNDADLFTTLALLIICITKIDQSEHVTLGVKFDRQIDAVVDGLCIPLTPLTFSCGGSQSLENFILSVKTKCLVEGGAYPPPTELALRYIKFKRFVESINNGVIFSFCKINPEEFSVNATVIWSVKDSLFIRGKWAGILSDHIQHLLKNISLNLNKKIKHIDINTPDDKKNILHYNQTLVEFKPRYKLLHDGFMRQVKLSPKATAVIGNEYALSYELLYIEALKISAYLKSNRCKPGDCIAICLPKSYLQIASVIGVLLMGGVFVPLNINDPLERRKKILKQCGAKFEIHSNNIGKIKSDSATFQKLKQAKPNDLAYVTFTSGTTGFPKGVMIQHNTVVNTIEAVNHLFNVNRYDAVLGLSELNFDLSIYDIFGVFNQGGVLVIPSERDKKAPKHWYELIQKNHITIWNSVPALMEMLIAYCQLNEKPFPNSITKIYLSGDHIPVHVVQWLQVHAPQATVISMGGATEAAIWSVYFKVDSKAAISDAIPYGKPLPNQKLYIYDKNLHPLPINVVGDIHIAGAGISNGYINNIEQTNSNFLIHPYTQETIYKTGDLGYLNNDDNIVFIGRKDTQIKLSGFRVELQEIEKALSELTYIKRNAVKLFSDGILGKNIYAFLQFEEGKQVSKEELESAIKKKIPSYMLPNQYRQVKHWPKSPNGKLDYGNIQKNYGQLIQPNYCIGRVTPVLKKIQSVIANTFNIDISAVDLSASFKANGGRSLSALSVVDALARSGIQISVSDLMIMDNLKALESVYSLISKKSPSSSAGEQTHYLNDAQLGMMFQVLWADFSPVYMSSAWIRIKGRFFHQSWQEAWARVTKKYPYLLSRLDLAQRCFHYGKNSAVDLEFIELPFGLYNDSDLLHEIKQRFLTFDSAGEILLHPVIFYGSSDEYYFVLLYRHVLLDGIGATNLLKTLMQTYMGCNIEMMLDPQILKDNLIDKSQDDSELEKFKSSFKPFNVEITSLNELNEHFYQYELLEIPDSSSLYLYWAQVLREVDEAESYTFGIVFNSCKTPLTNLGCFATVMPVLFSCSDSNDEIISNISDRLSKIYLRKQFNTKVCQYLESIVIIDDFSKDLVGGYGDSSNFCVVESSFIYGIMPYPISLTITFITKKKLNIFLQCHSHYITKKRAEKLLSHFIRKLDKAYV